MTSTTTIRQARGTDLDAIEALLTASDLPIEGIRDAACSLLVAESQSTIVGVIGLEKRGQFGLLRSAAVAPDWRSRGVGRQLVERMIAEAESRGVQALYLLTTTAERYFPSFGFSVTRRDQAPAEIQETWEFKHGCSQTAIAMCLDPCATR